MILSRLTPSEMAGYSQAVWSSGPRWLMSVNASMIRSAENGRSRWVYPAIPHIFSCFEVSTTIPETFWRSSALTRSSPQSLLRLPGVVSRAGGCWTIAIRCLCDEPCANSGVPYTNVYGKGEVLHAAYSQGLYEQP